MNRKQQIEQQLWSYIDGSATTSEKLMAEEMLRVSDEWKAIYKEQLELHQLLSNELELEQPPLRFSKNVMDDIALLQPKRATNTYINKNIIRSIAAFFLLTISALLIYSFTQIDWAAESNNTSTNLKDLGFQLPKYNFSQLFNSSWLNLLLMCSAIIGLMLMDRLLNRKKSVTQPERLY